MKNILKKRKSLYLCTVFVALAAFVNSVLAAPDENLLGKAQGYPVGNYKNWFNDEAVRVGSFSNMDKILPAHTLEKSVAPSNLRRAQAETAFRYEYNGTSNSVDDFLAHQRITGLLIIKDGEILLERYQYDRKPTDRLMSHSMVKSVTSLAVGFALKEGKISSLDDKVAKYIPELAGYAYGESSLRNLLRMSSGVKFFDNAGDHDDLQRFINIFFQEGLVKAIQTFNEYDVQEGRKFNYATSQTFILGLVIKHATGKNISEYVDEKIWKPMGAEADAKWNTDLAGDEMAGGWFSAVLRDYGRLGVLLANDGMLHDRQVLPKDYLLEATDWHKQPDELAPGHATPSFGYGYQFWILPGEKRRFALMGHNGQMIYVDPELKLVMVHTAVASDTADAKQSLLGESYRLWAGVERQFQSRQAVNLPAEIKQVFDQMSAAWAKQDMDGVIAQYHPNYSSSTAQNIGERRSFLEKKLMPNIRRLDWKITALRMDGDRAYINGVIDADGVTFPFPDNTQLIKEGGRWYIYGDRRSEQK